MIRKMDKLGRVVIPIEMRKTFNLKTEEYVEIKEGSNGIILTEYKDIYCPECLVKCSHLDNFCRNCGINFKEYSKKEN